MKRTISVLLLLGAIQAQGQTIRADTEVTRTGFFQLRWTTADADVHVVQEDTLADFSTARTIYKGLYTARTLSGLPNGIYYYRVRSKNGSWSAPLQVSVDHYPLSTALFFLGLGAIVFIATAIVTIRGHLRHGTYENSDAEG